MDSVCPASFCRVCNRMRSCQRNALMAVACPREALINAFRDRHWAHA